MKKTIEKLKCTRCGKQFWPKIDDETNELILPKTCRGQTCKSPYWNVKKIRYF